MGDEIWLAVTSGDVFTTTAWVVLTVWDDPLCAPSRDTAIDAGRAPGSGEGE